MSRGLCGMEAAWPDSPVCAPDALTTSAISVQDHPRGNVSNQLCATLHLPIGGLPC